MFLWAAAGLVPSFQRGKKWPFWGRLNVLRPSGCMVQAPTEKMFVLAKKLWKSSFKNTENRSDTVSGRKNMTAQTDGTEEVLYDECFFASGVVGAAFL